jgi:hypothetical protein
MHEMVGSTGIGRLNKFANEPATIDSLPKPYSDLNPLLAIELRGESIEIGVGVN